MLRHVLKSQQFDRALLLELFRETKVFAEKLESSHGKEELRRICPHRLLFTIFYEPSTRTRASFESAAHYLGMNCFSTENARVSSSAFKDEPLENSIENLCGYRPDVIVLRYHEEGGAERARAISTVPIINAGDGPGQHPTQSLLDIYSMWKDLHGEVDGITALIGGDLRNGRVARSDVYLLSKFKGIRFKFVSPNELRMKDDVLAHLREHDVPYSETENLEEVLPEADVVYWTRIQRERMTEEELARFAPLKDRFVLGERHLPLMKKNAIILHPQPIAGEIEPRVKLDPRARWKSQSANGLPSRMVLLTWVMNRFPHFH